MFLDVVFSKIQEKNVFFECSYFYFEKIEFNRNLVGLKDCKMLQEINKKNIRKKLLKKLGYLFLNFTVVSTSKWEHLQNDKFDKKKLTINFNVSIGRPNLFQVIH